ncbi:MAG: LCP family protein [Butyrivibrio sp.]|nr:LCP family protein [Butyrivibrio sp.]
MNFRKTILMGAVAMGIIGAAGAGGVLLAGRQNTTVVRRADSSETARTESSVSAESDSAGTDNYIKDTFDGSVTYEGVKYEVNTAIDTVLFLGIDSSDQSREGIGIDEGGRSDTIILFAIDNENKVITPLEINRDTMVNVDIYDNDGNYLAQGLQHLTMQYSYGNTPSKASNLIKEKVSDLLCRTRIDSVISLTMEGIEPMVDSMGGVTLQLQTDETEIDPTYTKGTIVHLDGAAAFDFVHTRDIETRGSNESRMSRQTQFMLAFFQTIKETGDSIIETMEEAGGDYLYEDIDADTMKHFTEYDRADKVYTLPGDSVEGKLHDEFYVDENKLTELVLELFYKRAE